MTSCDIHLYRNINEKELETFKNVFQNYIDTQTEFYYDYTDNSYNYDLNYDIKKNIWNYKLFSNNGNWYFEIELNVNYLVCHTNFNFKLMKLENENVLLNTVLEFVKLCNSNFDNLFIINY